MQHRPIFRIRRFLWLIIVGILCAGWPCLGLDPGIYQGTWRSRDDESGIVLKIGQDPEQVDITIHERPLLGVKASYLYAPSAVYPFLFLRAVEENADPQAEYLLFDHAFYLIIGALEEGNGRPAGILRGFYEYSRVKNDHHGTVESVSYPLELMPEQ